MALDLTKFRNEDTVDLDELILHKQAAIPTGCFPLDLLTGIGGLPRGRVVESFGPQSSGKSTALYQAIGQVQRLGGVGAIYDYENAFTPRYGQILGISTDPEELLVETPRSLEAGFKHAHELTRAAGEAGVPCICLFDSLALMPLEKEISNELTDEQMRTMGMEKARRISDLFRNITGDIGRAGAVWAFVNHEKVNIQTGWSAPGAPTRRTPGGAAVAYVATMRFRFAKGKAVKAKMPNPITGELEDTVIAHSVKITTEKNKLSLPNRSVSAFLSSGAGFDDAMTLAQGAAARGFLEKESASIFLVGERRCRSMGEVVEALREDDAVASDLRARITAAAESSWAV